MTGHSSKTITSFMHYYRQLVTSVLEIEDSVIGGNGIVVEIDESKFGKRKYHRGHMVEGSWVFGGIERTPEKRIFLVTVPDRSAETLLNVLKEHIHPGSIIYSDMWKSYNGINEILGLQHSTVNHSFNFKDPDTGVHTNTVEGLWNGIKLRIPPRNRGQSCIDEHLMEFIWRKQNRTRLWFALLEALANIHYD
jgi:transposase-like protein